MECHVKIPPKYRIPPIFFHRNMEFCWIGISRNYYAEILLYRIPLDTQRLDKHLLRNPGMLDSRIPASCDIFGQLWLY